MQAKILVRGFLKGQFKAKTYMDLWIDADIKPMSFSVSGGDSICIHTNSMAKIDDLRSHRDYGKAIDVRISEYRIYITFTKKTPNTIYCKGEYVGKNKDIFQITIRGDVLG